MEAEGKGWDPVKLALGPPPPPPPPTPFSLTPLVIHYWSFQGSAFIVVYFVNCYVVIHFLMFFFL